MASVCRHWGVTPAEYWAMCWADRSALVDHMNEEAREKKREQARAAARGRRRRR